MRVAITGAAGLIGGHVVRHLRKRGHQVLEVVRTANQSQGEEMVADLSTSPAGFDFLGWRPDAVVHLAAIPSPGVVEDDDLFVNNSVATSNVLYAAATAGVRRVVVASSISVYGYVWSGERRPPLPSVPLKESSPVFPSDGYALTKEVDEATGRMYARRYGMSVALLRFPNVSTLADAMARRAQVVADPAVASRELWAYLTFDQANAAIESSLTAHFSGAVVANVVSPQSLYPGDVRPLVDRFFPEAENRLPAGVAQATYATDIARDLLAFMPVAALPDSEHITPAPEHERNSNETQL